MTAGALEAGIVGLDPEVLTPFYVDVVGFELSARLDYPQGTVHRLVRGPARLKIFYPAPPARPPARPDSWHAEAGWRYAALYLDARTEVHELADRIDVAGGAVVAAAKSYGPTKTIALVHDPEGNVLELIWEE